MGKTRTVDERLRRAAKAVDAASHLAIAGHVGPDGDALGSSLGFAVAARKAGKETIVSFGEPLSVADSFGFLPLDLLSRPADFPDEPEVMVVFDTASAERLGSLAGPASRAGTLIVLDHHATNKGFGDIAVVDPEAPATSELTYRLLRIAGWEIDETAAMCLYTGLVTDTGRFQYGSTRPATLRIAAELLEIGVRPERISQSLFENLPFGYLKLASVVLDRAVLEPDRSLVWSVMFEADLAASGIAYQDSDRLIDDLRIAREAEVALIIKEIGGAFKCSLRSRGLVDVGSIAQELGGGGHHNAAAFTHVGSVEEAVGAVRARLDE